ncbi:MAG: helix-turn-helix domain-containing protein [Actinomycetota bacterium]|nr:helix-turn-helix domain-containing protein [Actinomycetota bacterium]
MTVPDLLTVDEAARVLRIGRSAAYELAGRFLASGGSDGIPAVRVGRLLRIPRAALEQLMGTPISDVPTISARTSTAKAQPTKSTRRLQIVSDEPQLPLA